MAKELGGFTRRTKDEETGLSVMDEEDFRRRFPDGRMFSNPGLATPEHGRLLLDAAVRDATEALGKFLSGEDLVEEKAAAEAAAAAKQAADAAGTAGTAGASKRAPRWGGGRQARGQRGERRWGAKGGTEGTAHEVADGGAMGEGGGGGGGGAAVTGEVAPAGGRSPVGGKKARGEGDPVELSNSVTGQSEGPSRPGLPSASSP